MQRTLGRSIALAGACIGGGLAIQPVYSEPAVRSLVINGVEVLLISAALSGTVLMVGAVAHKLEDWNRSLPPSAPTLPVRFATSHDAISLAHEEIKADPAEMSQTDEWRAAIRRFACIGNIYGFSWTEMAPSMGRDDWTACCRLMFEAQILIKARGKRPTHWATGWSYTRFNVEVKHGRIDLPFPKDPPPQIEWSRTVSLMHA